MPYCKILIIDDDEDDIEILAEACTESGVEGIHYEHSVMTAFMHLEQCKENLPKLIITDLYLPGITGEEFLIDLKHMELYKHIPVIVLTGSKTHKEIERYKQMGAVDYLEKPCSYEEYLKVAQYMKEQIN